MIRRRDALVAYVAERLVTLCALYRVRRAFLDADAVAACCRAHRCKLNVDPL